VGAGSTPHIDITPHWAVVQEDIVKIVGLVPDDKIDWSPKDELWNFRGILIHISDARDRWMDRDVQDGEGYPNIWTTAKTKADLTRELERTWERLGRFLADPAKIGAMYPGDGTHAPNSGHFIAYHLLEHDIHHRAELLQRLALLDIAHGIDI
jgi:uncharacterized damage-inducible protein DinB